MLLRIVLGEFSESPFGPNRPCRVRESGPMSAQRQRGPMHQIGLGLGGPPTVKRT
jgi:hypothetical protein